MLSDEITRQSTKKKEKYTSINTDVWFMLCKADNEKLVIWNLYPGRRSDRFDQSGVNHRRISPTRIKALAKSKYKTGRC